MNDVFEFIAKIDSVLFQLVSYSNKFCNEFPEWNNVINEAVNNFTVSLSSVSSDESVRSTANRLKVPIKIVVVANKITLSSLFALSNYLKYENFDISNPVDFYEISDKLSFSRQVLIKLGFFLAKAKLDNEISEKDIIRSGIKIGLSLGYLINVSFIEGHEKALSILHD